MITGNVVASSVGSIKAEDAHLWTCIAKADSCSTINVSVTRAFLLFSVTRAHDCQLHSPPHGSLHGDVCQVHAVTCRQDMAYCPHKMLKEPIFL